MHRELSASGRIALGIVRGFLDADRCREVIEDMRHSHSAAAVVYGQGEPSVDERVRRVNRVLPSVETVTYLKQRLEEYRPQLEKEFRIELTGCEEPQFLCYEVGGFFVAHQDGNTGMINTESDRTRRISVTIFLNNQSAEGDNDCFVGGSLVFSDRRTAARQEVAGEAGMLVAFRSETTHEVTPVTHGRRYAIVSWYINTANSSAQK